MAIKQRSCHFSSLDGIVRIDTVKIRERKVVFRKMSTKNIATTPYSLSKVWRYERADGQTWIPHVNYLDIINQCEKGILMETNK